MGVNDEAICEALSANAKSLTPPRPAPLPFRSSLPLAGLL